jgi:cyanophycinase
MILPLILLVAQQADYVRVGQSADVITKTKAGYALLGGGRDVEEAFRWMIDRSGGGDFLVLRAGGTAAYNLFVQKLGRLNSVATMIIRTREQSAQPEVVRRVRQAEAIFLAGGDQWNYVRLWKGTPLGAALAERIRAGVPVGGTSAGLAVLGEHYFSAKFDTVTSEEALQNPFDRKVALGKNFLKIEPLRRIITDSHFTQRRRMGRLAVWLARLPRVRGIGIDEATALLVERDGKARVVGRERVWLMRARGKAERCQPKELLTFRELEVHVLGKGDQFDLLHWRGIRTAEPVVVQDGVIWKSPL